MCLFHSVNTLYPVTLEYLISWGFSWDFYEPYFFKNSVLHVHLMINEGKILWQVRGKICVHVPYHFFGTISCFSKVWRIKHIMKLPNSQQQQYMSYPSTTFILVTTHMICGPIDRIFDLFSLRYLFELRLIHNDWTSYHTRLWDIFRLVVSVNIAMHIVVDLCTYMLYVVVTVNVNAFL